MENRKFKRQHLRAPLFTEFLFEDDSHVLKARVNNISEGGVLLEALPHVPEINLMPLMLEIPEYPSFSNLGREKLLSVNLYGIESKILRVRAKMVRTFEAKSAVDLIFVPKIGCRFVTPSDEFTETIKNYVSTFSKNMIFLLNLFESSSSKTQIDIIRHVSSFLGYQSDEKISILRQKVLHDYQSLESV
ncbi:MAG: PilZ domain-containing protein [Bacteriovoracaceae bacterium]|nr:PilZ domain-containing protein [Bacteriovoracaceae bacterium]